MSRQFSHTSIPLLIARYLSTSPATARVTQAQADGVIMTNNLPSTGLSVSFLIQVSFNQPNKLC